MKKRVKIIATVSALILCAPLGILGVLAASHTTLSIAGSVSFESEGVYVAAIVDAGVYSTESAGMTAFKDFVDDEGEEETLRNFSAKNDGTPDGTPSLSSFDWDTASLDLRLTEENPIGMYNLYITNYSDFTIMATVDMGTFSGFDYVLNVVLEEDFTFSTFSNKEEVESSFEIGTGESVYLSFVISVSDYSASTNSTFEPTISFEKSSGMAQLFTYAKFSQLPSVALGIFMDWSDMSVPMEADDILITGIANEHMLTEPANITLPTRTPNGERIAGFFPMGFLTNFLDEETDDEEYQLPAAYQFFVLNALNLTVPEGYIGMFCIVSPSVCQISLPSTLAVANFLVLDVLTGDMYPKADNLSFAVASENQKLFSFNGGLYGKYNSNGSTATYLITAPGANTPLVLADGVKRIGGGFTVTCFGYRDNFTSFVAPESVVEVYGQSLDVCGAFAGCSDLESITFTGENLTIIGRFALDCSSLASITLPEIHFYGDIDNPVYAITSCESLETLLIPSGSTFGFDNSGSSQYIVSDCENLSLYIDAEALASLSAEFFGYVVANVNSVYVLKSVVEAEGSVVAAQLTANGFTSQGTTSVETKVYYHYTKD